MQYAIFDRIYADSGLPVFFVGDPKQSIYSFRGADVFSYLQARRDAQAAHTLEVNWRSDAPLVEGGEPHLPKRRGCPSSSTTSRSSHRRPRRRRAGAS